MSPEEVVFDRTIEEARRVIADLALAEGETKFAREVLAGCWDHRKDVRAALSSEFKPRKLNVKN